MNRRALVPLIFALAFGAIGCTDDDELGSVDQAVISDQNHGGVAGFVFLPPVVPPPASFGDFVPAVAPIVVAQQIDPADGVTVVRTLATYTRTSAGPERVRVHVQGALPDDGDEDPTGYFVVRFRSADLGVVGGDLVRFRVTVDGRELGWADVKVLDQRKDKKLIDRSQYGFVVAGKLLRVKFRVDREALAQDSDGDGIDDAHDVCPQIADPDQSGDACRCDAVVCAPSHDGCVVGACEPATGACGPERCVEDFPATLSGTVYGIQLGALADAAILITGPTGTVQATTGAGGVFSVQVPFAESDLQISRPGFAPYFQHLHFGPDELGEGYEILLTPTAAWYDVTVWGAVGIPLPHASVNVHFQGGSAVGGSTDAFGQVHFALLPVGEPFTLDVTAEGVAPVSVEHDPLTAGSNTTLVGMY